MGSTADLCTLLAHDGYVVADGLFEPDALARAHAETAVLFETTPFGRDDFEGHKTRRIYALFAKTRAFDGVGHASRRCSPCSTRCCTTTT